MTRFEQPDPEKDFEDRWREWANRPPRKSPAFAAVEIKRRLRQADGLRRWRAPVAAAAVLAACGFLGVRLLSPPKPAPLPAELSTAAPLAEGQVLIWLDPDTPLYMTYQNPPGGNQ
jgi:hypothetical protein